MWSVWGSRCSHCPGNHPYEGEERIPAVEEEIKKMGREVKSVVEAALDLYLNGSVDDAYRWPPWMSKLTTILKLSVTLRLKRLRKSRSHCYGS